MMRAEIDQLLGFLPLFEQPGRVFLAASGGDGKPVYVGDVQQFFELAAQPCWTDLDYDPAEAGRMLEDECLIDNASLYQIRSMLTYCVRGERFNPGHWDAVLRSGQVTGLLRRLAELRRSTEPMAMTISAQDDSVQVEGC